jgi:hypothetical protein
VAFQATLLAHWSTLDTLILLRLVRPLKVVCFGYFVAGASRFACAVSAVSPHLLSVPVYNGWKSWITFFLIGIIITRKPRMFLHGEGYMVPAKTFYLFNNLTTQCFCTAALLLEL